MRYETGAANQTENRKELNGRGIKKARHRTFLTRDSSLARAFYMKNINDIKNYVRMSALLK